MDHSGEFVKAKVNHHSVLETEATAHVPKICIKMEPPDSVSNTTSIKSDSLALDCRKQLGDSAKVPADAVESFLLTNPAFLDSFVTNHVTLEQIYKWISLKEKSPIITPSTSLSEGYEWNTSMGSAQETSEAAQESTNVERLYMVTTDNGATSSPVNDAEKTLVEIQVTKASDRSETKTQSSKTNRRKLTKPSRVTSSYANQPDENDDVNAGNLPGNYFIERCNLCDKAFFSFQSFKLHSCAAKQNTNLNCTHCTATFRDMGLFNKHVSSKRCTQKDCNAQFFCAEKYHQHISSHSMDNPHHCQHCDTVFNEKAHLKAHLQSQHGIRPFQCDRCGKRFTQSGNLKRHIRLHNGEKPYTCTICQRAFSDQSHLKYHLKQHSGQKPYICSQCDKAFLTATNLRQHTATHLDKEYHCLDCGKDFRTGHELKRHTDSCHKPKAQSCIHCNRVFSKPSLLRSHMFDTGNKPYTCKYCSLVLPCAGRIKTHARTHTLESPKYKCPDCDMLFDKGANLKSHIRTHLQFRPFECSECGKCFTQSGNLRRHLRIHSGEKPFKCNQCSLAFSDQSHLKYHSIQAHSAVRPFPCTYCGKGFITSSKLKSHLRVHDPERNGKTKVDELETSAVFDSS